ncbi:MAG: DUF4369 domain-containing protein [Prevotella sp.]
MKKFIGYILLTLIAVSCGAPSGYFRIEGRLRNFNQGEFYIYSPDENRARIDTIKVSQGRFNYETRLDEPATFVIVFPNYSEQVVFGESGATATIKGDASHLKELEVKGTETNEKMTEWRMMVNRLTPPEVKGEAEKFINENPLSPISAYLLRKYFIEAQQPDYTKATKLATLMAKADRKNIRIDLLAKKLSQQQNIEVGDKLPKFSAVDINGKTVNNSYLKGKLNIITTWATWNYESQSIQRMLERKKKDYGNSLAIVSICLDANINECRKRVRSDSIKWSNICNGNMWDTPVLKTLSIANIPGNIVCDANGKIIARNLRADKLDEKIKELLKKE